MTCETCGKTLGRQRTRFCSYACRYHLTLAERMSKYTNRAGADECWEWTGHKDTRRGGQGYGYIGDGSVTRRAHRVAWELVNGPIPQGLYVCHRCDSPPCVNPIHLFLGTQTDNMRDMWRKGRGKLVWVRGERQGSSKLTNQQAREIKASSARVTDLAIQYGVSKSTICTLRNGKRWKWLAAEGSHP